jgi:hypothetical protein
VDNSVLTTHTEDKFPEFESAPLVREKSSRFAAMIFIFCSACAFGTQCIGLVAR